MLFYCCRALRWLVGFDGSWQQFWSRRELLTYPRNTGSYLKYCSLPDYPAGTLQGAISRATAGHVVITDTVPIRHVSYYNICLY